MGGSAVLPGRYSVCVHSEHKVEVLPDGQVDETHVFGDHEEFRFTWGGKSIRALRVLVATNAGDA